VFFLLAQQAAADVSSASAAPLAFSAALAAVLVIAAGRLFPFFGAWLVSHNHPVLAEAADVAAIYEQERERGKSQTEALDTALHSQEGKDLVAQAVSHFGGKS
jgi:hypothetical protein